MQEQKSPNDLLQQWALEKSRAHIIRNRWLTAIAIAVLTAGVIEQIQLGSVTILTSIVLGGLIAIGLGLAILYSVFIFTIGLAYAKFVRQKGQTRPSAWHILTMVALAAAIAVFLAAYTIQETIAAPFWVVIVFVVWTNILSSTLGYFAEFLLKSRL